MLRSDLMKKLLASILFGLSLASCSAESNDPATRTASAPGYPRTVATFDGSELVLSRPPTRVIPANAAALEILADLDLLDRVVSIPTPAFDYGNIDLDPGAWNGRTFEHYLVEPMLVARPDLVMTNPWQNPETTSFLAENDIAILSIPAPTTFEDLLAAIRVTGEVLEVPERAETLCEGLRQRLAALQSRERKDLRVMTYTTFGTGSWTAAKNTTADLLIRFAGMRNASTEHGLEGHAAIDIETVLTIDPDYILVGASPDDPRWSTTLESMRNDPALATLSALRDDHVLILPLKHFTANSHYLVDAAEFLSALIEN